MRILAWTTLMALLLQAPALEAGQTLRYADVNADGHLDRLQLQPDSVFEVSLHAGRRHFESVARISIGTDVSDVLVADLNHDGNVDLYLLSPGSNVALLGDSTGHFVDATADLGLEDNGLARSARLEDVDGDGLPELLLRNAGSEVLFWAESRTTYRRETSSPTSTARPDPDALGALLQILAENYQGPLALSEETTVEIGLDQQGSPVISLGSTPIAPAPSLQTTLTPGPGLRDPSAVPTTPGQPKAPAPSPSHMLSQEDIDILSHLSIVYLDDGLGNLRKTIRVEGVNLQVVNGLGATNGLPGSPEDETEFTLTNGVGNLIVGYNEPRFNTTLRTGSHNVVVGQNHIYTSFGGVVAGDRNEISSFYSCVTGGENNRATGPSSSIVGGATNLASGSFATISGGGSNQATGFASGICGGSDNVASGSYSVISGGESNSASGSTSACLAGTSNSAIGTSSAVAGGHANMAISNYSTVAGGEYNSAQDRHAMVSGGQFNIASGEYSSVNGGLQNTAQADWSVVAAGEENTATGVYSVVLGGKQNTASGNYASITAGLANIASGLYAAITAGNLNVASGDLSSITGGQLNQANGGYATVSGGEENIAGVAVPFIQGATVSGGFQNFASGDHGTVSGGAGRTAPNPNNWSAGSLFEEN